jgi:thioesterase domain-containing protein
VIVNRGATHPEMSVRLEEADAEVTKLTCLDFWLENGERCTHARIFARMKTQCPVLGGSALD